MKDESKKVLKLNEDSKVMLPAIKVRKCVENNSFYLLIDSIFNVAFPVNYTFLMRAVCSLLLSLSLTLVRSLARSLVVVAIISFEDFLCHISTLSNVHKYFLLADVHCKCALKDIKLILILCAVVHLHSVGGDLKST
jgi:hypothetical protein